MGNINIPGFHPFRIQHRAPELPDIREIMNTQRNKKPEKEKLKIIFIDIRVFLIYNIAVHGPVAQLGERSVRIREVVGSNPFRSTKSSRFRTVLRSEEAITSFALNSWLDIDEKNRQFIMSRLFLFLFSCSV